MCSDFLTVAERFELMTEVEKNAFHALHDLLAQVKAAPVNRVGLQRDPVQFIEDIEYTLQGIWGFSRDSSYHTHWLDIEGCTCPYLDNTDPLYRGRRIVHAECPWHGGKHVG